MNGKKKTSIIENLDGEIWRDVKGFEGIYMVSNKGRVKSLDRKVWNYMKPGRVLRPQVKGNNYLQICLADSNRGIKYKHVYVHRLVAEAFLPNPRGCKEINHKDFNKQNNSVSNLEWVTKQENLQHYRKSRLAKKVEAGRQDKFTSKALERINHHKRDILDLYDSGLSVDMVSKELGIGRDFVTGVLKIFDKL